MSLTSQVLDRLGFCEPPPADLEGLFALYRSWCLNVPFDNIRKLISLRRGDPAPFPGTESEDFLAAWLLHGTGGTCWAGSNGLYAFLKDCGFDAYRTTGSMWDGELDGHGTTIVEIEGRSWLVDSSVLTMAPLPLVDGEAFFYDDGIFHSEIDHEDQTFFLWTYHPPFPHMIPCRIIERDVPHSLYVKNHERSREFSGFNTKVYARRHFVNKIAVISGTSLTVKNRDGVITEELDSDTLLRTMSELFGYSDMILQEFVDSGAHDLNLAPAPARERPKILRTPPSLKTR